VIKKARNIVRSDYILVILLLVFSGNPIIRFFDKSTLLLLSIIILIVKFRQFKKDFFVKFFIILSALLILFMLQNIVLNFVSWLGAFRYLTTWLFGGMIFYLVSDRFSYRFFIVLYYIALISLFGYVIINLLNVPIPGLAWGGERRPLTYIIYTFVVDPHHYRNCGMFWEPGAFAGILTLCIALNIKFLPELWKNHKFKILVIVVALLTTKSTTGYLVFFIIVFYYMLFFMKSKLIKIALMPALLLVIGFVYANTEFLREKIEEQTERTSTLAKGDYYNSRFGSFKLDMHYIQKHPLVGNGLHEKTRYADDPYIIQLMASGVSLGSGNGFSNYLACMGIPFMFFYLLITFKVVAKADARVAFLIVLVIVSSLWGEQWLQYPIYTGLVFLRIKKYFDENCFSYSRF